MTKKQILQLVFALIVSFYFIQFIFHLDAMTDLVSTIIRGTNLLIHEAGHWIFWPFGEFMHVLGGSLNQVLIPSLFVIYFYLRSEFYSAGFTLFWVGENFLEVARYAGDAVARQLPLLGGDGVIHDWNWLLTETGQLPHTETIAFTIKLIGTLLIFSAAVWSIWAAITTQEKITIDE